MKETFWSIMCSVNPVLGVLGVLVGLFLGYHLGYRHARGEFWMESLRAGWFGPLGQVIRAIPVILMWLLAALIALTAAVVGTVLWFSRVDQKPLPENSPLASVGSCHVTLSRSCDTILPPTGGETRDMVISFL